MSIPSGITVLHAGSVVLIRPDTTGAKEWLERHCDSAAMWFGGSLVCEPRYVEPIVRGAAADGFTVKRAEA